MLAWLLVRRLGVIRTRQFYYPADVVARGRKRLQSEASTFGQLLEDCHLLMLDNNNNMLAYKAPVCQKTSETPMTLLFSMYMLPIYRHLDHSLFLLCLVVTWCGQYVGTSCGYYELELFLFRLLKFLHKNYKCILLESRGPRLK